MRPIYTQTTVLDTAGLVSIEMVRNHLRLFGDTSMDNVLNPLISVATHRIEKFVGRLYSDRTLVDYYEGEDVRFELSQQGADTVTSVQYYNTDNVLTTIATNQYYVDTTSQFPAVVISGDNPFNGVNDRRANPVLITYAVTAPDATLVSPDIQHAALLMIGDWFRDPENSTSENLTAIPLGAERLLQPYRRY